MKDTIQIKIFWDVKKEKRRTIQEKLETQHSGPIGANGFNMDGGLNKNHR